MTERERIAYQCGYNDGVRVMRERLKDLLREGNGLQRHILAVGRRQGEVLFMNDGSGLHCLPGRRNGVAATRNGHGERDDGQ